MYSNIIMNFSESELKQLLNIIQRNSIQNGGFRQINSPEEHQIINKMKLKYGDDYLNQLNIIQNKYNDMVGGVSWLSRKTGVSAKPLKASFGQALSTLGTAAITTGVAVGTAKLAEQQAQVIQPQPTPTPTSQPVPEQPKDELTLVKEENGKLKEEIIRLQKENDELKQKLVIPQAGGNKNISHKVIIENTLYTIDSNNSE